MKPLSWAGWSCSWSPRLLLPTSAGWAPTPHCWSQPPLPFPSRDWQWCGSIWIVEMIKLKNSPAGFYEDTLKFFFSQVNSCIWLTRLHRYTDKFDMCVCLNAKCGMGARRSWKACWNGSSLVYADAFTNLKGAFVRVCVFNNLFLGLVLCCCRCIQSCSSLVDYSWNPPTPSQCLGNKSPKLLPLWPFFSGLLWK